LVVAAVIAEVFIAIAHPPYDAFLQRWGSALADALIAIGIVGEVLFSMIEARCQTELRIRSNAKLEDAIAQAGEANERAAEANQKAQEAILETARLRAKEQLVDDALLANAQAARAIALVAQQNGATAERLALAQGLITPGQMSEAARSLSIVSKINPFAGKQFDAVTTSNHIELGVFLRSLRAALTTAGWIEVDLGEIDERQREQSNVGGPVLVTIHADSTRDPQLLDAATTLASALNSEGIAAIVNPKTETDATNVIHILVGPKP
jgi:multidrug efflux pump subunit AcrA (membrane-fusion protein)